jgi:hypothetical protein
MNRTIRRILATVGATALSIGGLTLASSPAANAAAADPGAYISLISPVLTDANTSEAAANQAMANTWIAAGWFASGLKYQRAFAPVASTVNFVYHVQDASGNPLVGASVTLRVNKQYSNSQAAVTVDGQNAKPGTQSADGLRVTHFTDGNGNVAFAVIDKDAAGTAEFQPTSLTAAPNVSDDGLNDIHVQVLPFITGHQEKDDHTAITEIHFYDPASNAAQPVTNPTIRLSAPALTDTNSVHRTDLETLFSVTNNWYPSGLHVRQAYLPTGSTNLLSYNVTDDNGAPLQNSTVTLHVNKAYSGSNAKLTDGTTPTDSTKNDAANTGNQDQALWTGTTDAFGNVFFNMHNTDTVGEPAPASLTAAVPQTGGVFSQIFPVVTSGADHADMVEFHFFGVWKAPTRSVAASITGTAKVGKVLTAATGTWAGTTPIAYSYKWYRCTVAGTSVGATAPNAAAKCTIIAGKTAATYTLTSADKGKFVRVLVTGSNKVGTGLSLSKSTGKIG